MTRVKKIAHDSSDSCDSIIVSFSSYLKEKSILSIVDAIDLVIFSDETTSAAGEEMVGISLSFLDKGKEVALEFVSIASVASTRSEVLWTKFKKYC